MGYDSKTVSGHVTGTIVSDERPKMLSGLNQNDEGYGWDARLSSHVIHDSPGVRKFF